MIKKVTGRNLLVIAGMILIMHGIAAYSGGIRPAEGWKKKEKAILKAAKEGLNGTKWEIELTRITAKKKRKTIKDILHFTEGMVESENLAPEGFSSSNFSVRIKRADIIVWETMQKNEKGATAFWRGELNKDNMDTMRGVLSWHSSEKDKRDYTFVSVGKESGPAEAEIQEPGKPEPGAKKPGWWFWKR